MMYVKPIGDGQMETGLCNAGRYGNEISPGFVSPSPAKAPRIEGAGSLRLGVQAC